MTPPPGIQTRRLVLRPYTMADAPAVQRIVSDREVAVTTLSIPHPYPENGAVEWIQKQQKACQAGEQVVFAITLRDGGELAGSIDLRLKPEHRHAELGYLIAKEQWGNGYATEAAAAVVAYGFESLGLNRIYAHHMTVNPASGRVMQKIGMRHEGTMRQHILKWGEPRDIAFYGITAGEYRDFKSSTRR